MERPTPSCSMHFRPSQISVIISTAPVPDRRHSTLQRFTAMAHSYCSIPTRNSVIATSTPCYSSPPWEAVNILLAAGSDPSATSNPPSHKCRRTPLIAAIQINLEPTAIPYVDQMDSPAPHEAMEDDRRVITSLMFARGIALTVPPPPNHTVHSGLGYVTLRVTHPRRGCQHSGRRGSDGNSCVYRRHRCHLENGADPDADPAYQHSLDVAACAGQAVTVKKLLVHGVDLRRLLNSNYQCMLRRVGRAVAGCGTSAGSGGGSRIRCTAR